ncbi:MAG: Spy/CpxP family protein refolding chaperone [bacterium]|nr:Spy/CpxP family protein refolding chaperone [bacterium]
MTQRRVTIVAIAAILTIAPAVLMAQGFFGADGPKGQGRHDRSGCFGTHMSAFLDLTEEQEAQIEQIRNAYEPILQDLREQKRTARQEYMQGLDASNFDEGAVRAFAESQAVFDIELTVNRAKLKAELHSVLTEEQKQLLAEHKSKMTERQGRRGGRGRGARS